MLISNIYLLYIILQTNLRKINGLSTINANAIMERLFLKYDAFENFMQTFIGPLFRNIWPVKIVNAIFKQMYLPLERSVIYQILLTAMKYGTADEATVMDNIWIVFEYLSDFIIITRCPQATSFTRCHLWILFIIARFTLLHFIHSGALHATQSR